MKKVFGKKYSSIIQVLIFVLCISSVCAAGVVEFTDEAAFTTAAGEPQHFIDFETYGNGTPVVGQPSIDGDEWSNFGIQFDALEVGDSLLLYDDPGSKGEYVSPIHALLAPDETDITSYLITFSTPVESFGMYIVGNETGSVTERIILKDDSGTVLGDYDMPFGGGDDDAFFRGYLTNTPIAEVHIIEDLDGEGLLLDNVMYSVPEPAMLLLLSLGGLALRRRSGQALGRKRRA